MDATARKAYAKEIFVELWITKLAIDHVQSADTERKDTHRR